MASLVKEKAEASARNVGGTSHNLSGQRLGRKGLATRDRIVSAMLNLLSDAEGPPLTLTAVAREAGIGLSNLYLYFPGLSDLLLAALSQVMESHAPDFMGIIRKYWPADKLEECCQAFVMAHFEFWSRHVRLLHLRDAIADANDQRVVDYRYYLAKPVMDDLAAQMDSPDGRRCPMAPDTALILFTSLERMAKIYTTRGMLRVSGRVADEAFRERMLRQLCAEAHILALAIRDGRDTAARQ